MDAIGGPTVDFAKSIPPTHTTVPGPATRLLDTSLDFGSGIRRVTRSFVFLFLGKAILLGRSHGRRVGIWEWGKFSYGFSYFAHMTEIGNVSYGHSPGPP